MKALNNLDFQTTNGGFIVEAVFLYSTYRLCKALTESFSTGGGSAGGGSTEGGGAGGW